MASKSKVSISTGPTKYRLSSADRHAAHVKEIAGRQEELKREAAERRAKRAATGAASTDVTPPASSTDVTPQTARTDLTPEAGQPADR